MTSAGARGRRTGLTLAAMLLCAASWVVPDGDTPTSAAPAGVAVAAATAVVTAVHSRGPAPSAGPRAAVLPRIGADILPVTRTCARAHGRGTPTTSAQCAAWGSSGPVNIVVVWPGATALPPALRLPPAPWRAAAGGWLVAAGDTVAGPAGCAAGAHDSHEQLELRIDRVTRRHLKVVHTRCGAVAAPLGVVFDDAHTDRWEPGCGDRAVDWDGARDDLVHALSRLPAFVRVEYSAAPAAAPVFPGGCGRMIASDGRVAYVLMSASPRL